MGIDDGSQDRPERDLPNDSRVRFIRQPARGIVAALERGRAEAKGQYLARLDSDSVLGPVVYKQVATLGRTQSESFGGKVGLHPEQRLPPEGMRWYLAWLNQLQHPRRELLVESPVAHPAVMMRAIDVERVGGYRDFQGPEDYDLWLRLVQAGGHIRNLDQEVVWIRDHGFRLTRVDPRYSLAAFRRTKMEWVRTELLKPGQRIVVWGGGRTGRPWIRWLMDQQCDLVAVLDLKSGGARYGVPVFPTEAIADLSVDLLLVAVGARGARSLIREMLSTLRPDLTEGHDWWAVA